MCQVCLYEFGNTDDAEVLTRGFIGEVENFSEEAEIGRGELSDRRALAGV
jgi:hypothetical protein